MTSVKDAILNGKDKRKAAKMGYVKPIKQVIEEIKPQEIIKIEEKPIKKPKKGI